MGTTSGCCRYRLCRLRSGEHGTAASTGARGRLLTGWADYIDSVTIRCPQGMDTQTASGEGHWERLSWTFAELTAVSATLVSGDVSSLEGRRYNGDLRGHIGRCVPSGV